MHNRIHQHDVSTHLLLWVMILSDHSHHLLFTIRLYAFSNQIFFHLQTFYLIIFQPHLSFQFFDLLLISPYNFQFPHLIL